MNSRGKVAPAGSPDNAGGYSADATPTVVRDAEVEQHFDSIAKVVSRLLGASTGRLRRRVAQWPHLLEDSDDICQLATLAFVEAYRQGRIAPDAASGVYTAGGVAGYAWGIVNRIFAGAIRRSRPRDWQYVENETEGIGTPYSTSALLEQDSGSMFEALMGGPGDEDSRLWEVLRSVEGRCDEKDIIVTYLLASGATGAEVRAVLGLSENVPRNALKRVGRGIREILGFDAGAAHARPDLPGKSTTGRRSAVPTEDVK